MSILVERYVDENNRSYHAGHGHANETSVSIENVNSTGEPDWKVSTTTYKGLVALTHAIAKRNGLLPLVPFQNLFPHDYWSATRCPGWLKTQLNNLAKDANSFKGDTEITIRDNLSPFFAVGRPSGIKSITIHHGATRNFAAIGATFKTRGVSANYGVSSELIGDIVKPNPSKPAKKTVQQLANEVMTGQWGNEPQRSQRLRAEGYDPVAVQNAVNARYGIGKPAPSKPSVAPITTVARQVIAGAFGNNPHREANLRRAGHDPAAVQREVNRLLGVGSSPTAPQNGIFVVGQRVQFTNPVDERGTRLGVSGTYTVMEVRGNRIVVGRGGSVTAATNSKNLKRV